MPGCPDRLEAKVWAEFEVGGRSCQKVVHCLLRFVRHTHGQIGEADGQRRNLGTHEFFAKVLMPLVLSVARTPIWYARKVRTNYKGSCLTNSEARQFLPCSAKPWKPTHGLLRQAESPLRTSGSVPVSFEYFAALGYDVPPPCGADCTA